MATRVLIERDRALGVRYARGPTEVEGAAAGEVVLCAGAVCSPHLLLLSGVGPVEHLRELGIDLRYPSPLVGRQLQDHPWCLPVWHTPTVSNPWEAVTPENLALWERGRGPLTTNGPEAGGFVRSRDGLSAPDLQLAVAPGPDPTKGAPTQRAMTTPVIAIDVEPRLGAPPVRGSASQASDRPRLLGGRPGSRRARGRRRAGTRDRRPRTARRARGLRGCTWRGRAR